LQFGLQLQSLHLQVSAIRFGFIFSQGRLLGEHLIPFPDRCDIRREAFDQCCILIPDQQDYQGGLGEAATCRIGMKMASAREDAWMSGASLACPSRPS
jgi:hypothetical protein